MEIGTIATDHLGDGMTLIAPAGEHDLESSSELGRLLADGLEGDGVVLDLSHATFVDSSVLGEIVTAHRRAEEEGKGFEVVLGQESAPGVRRVMEVTGLDRVLGLHADREDAVAAARPEGAPER